MCLNYKMKKNNLTFIIILNYVITVIFFLSFANIYSQNDKTILRTDNGGNILGGDMNEWDFNIETYSDREKFDYLFVTPFYKDSNYILDPELRSFNYEVSDEGILLKWSTHKEKNCKGFYVERAKILNEYQDGGWVNVGYVGGAGNSDETINYEFLDNDLENFSKYRYRLKLIEYDGEYQYHELGNEVFAKVPNTFEFYPSYPNPAIDTVNISFYYQRKML